MSGIRYLMDEDTDPLYVRQLVRREPRLMVRRVGSMDAPPISTPDPEILRWCEVHSFILITNNRATMPPHLGDLLAEGRHVPGVFVLNPSMTIRETIDELLLIWGASREDEYRDRIAYLPIA